ncbi:MAG: hypothetical protein Q7T16_02345 [Candidatus Burarchaeum sp.]|nr:hypothetical protein [Candidatus Burarchaeum sp.]MDO8339474.1 hypothetical protein [Candidatus Burarchaeum sp.]
MLVLEKWQRLVRESYQKDHNGNPKNEAEFLAALEEAGVSLGSYAVDFEFARAVVKAILNEIGGAFLLHGVGKRKTGKIVETVLKEMKRGPREKLEE